MTFGEIRLALYDYFGYGETPSPDVARRVDNFINEAYLELLTRPGLGKLRQTILTLTATANSPFMVLPRRVSTIRAIVNRTTTKPVHPISMQELRRRDPGNSDSSGDPTHYVELGQSALAVDISAAAELFVKSSSADDTGVQVTVDGILSSEAPRRLGGSTLNGTTAVSLDSSITTWTQITRFVLNGRAKGDVTLHEGSGSGTELARIPKGHTASSYQRLQLYPYPTSAVVLYADVVLTADHMVDSGDEPLIPLDYRWLIEVGARMRQLSRNGDHTTYAEERARYREGRGALFMHVNGGHGLEPSRPIAFSQLGPDFEAGT